MRKNGYLKQVGLDVIKIFENYTFDQIEISASIGIDDLKNAMFVKRKSNTLWTYRHRKDTSCISIGVASCMSSMKVKFYRTAALVNELIDAKNNETLNKFLKQIEQADIIICNEWGHIPIDIDGVKLLYQVRTGCYEKKSIILTTNLEFSK